MKPKTIEELYLDELTDQIAMRKEALAAGTAKDYAEYRHIAGVITGLTLAQNHFNGLLRKQREYDE